MPRSAREKLRPIVEDVHTGVIDALEKPSAASTPEESRALARRLDGAGIAGFASPDSAARLRSVCEILFHAHIDDDAVLDLLEACLSSPSPAAALLNVHRYLENAGGVAVFMGTVGGARPILDMITTVFGASQYMADIIIRNPSTVYWLMESTTWSSPDTVEAYTEWLSREAAMFRGTGAKLDAVRRAHRLALLKIGVADLVHGEPVEAVTRRLSHLADAVAGVVLDVVAEEVGATAGEGHGLAVIAMGKLGGGELNYSSDIDLIYACEDTGDETIALYTKWARRFTDALSELTPEGYLYRVDLRLRPDGQAGPLVNPETALRIYYENRGRPWEFQAMLKARVTAGNRELGERLLGVIGSLAFNPSLSYSPLDDIARMRVQIKENIPERERGLNIKLMEGGIRDVEFIAQTVQLMHGQRHPELRTPNTLEALGGIRRLGLLDEWTVDNLAAAYRFLRLVEHRLQMMHQLKTHTVPESRGDIELLARRSSKGPLGEYTTESFLDTLSRHLNNVRTFAESFFRGEEIHPHSVLLMLPEDDERASAIIGQHGLVDVKRAMRVLHTMAYGSFPRLLDRNVRAAFEELLPLLLEGVAEMGDPDLALGNVAKIAAAVRSESSFYKLLRQSDSARDLVLGIAGFSSLLTRALCAQIGVLDSLLHASDEVSFEMQFKEIPARDLFDIRSAIDGGDKAGARLERQRAWFDRARLFDFAENHRRRFQPLRGGARRAWLAARHVAAAFDSAVGKGQPVALFVLGSYAVDEPRVSSDADVIVVSDGADIPSVTERVQLINRWFTDGRILKLDFRLRGEGASAPLVQDLGYYESYLDRRLSLWERIALSKCRAWWGDAAVQSRFMDRLSAVVARPFARDEVSQLAEMRRRVEALAPVRYTVWETKRSAGGRYDVEYLTAVGLARFCAGDPDYFHMTTPERLARLASRGAIGEDDAESCADALELYALVDYLMELQELTHPRSEEKSAYLGSYLDRCFELLGINAPAGVESLLSAKKTRVRECYAAAMDRFAAG